MKAGRCEVWGSNWNIIFRDEAEKLLESKDIDIEGRLSYEQFMGEETRAEKLFKLMDKDGDGWISKNVSQKSIVFSNWVIISMLNKSSNLIILKYPDIWPALSATSELDLIFIMLILRRIYGFLFPHSDSIFISRSSKKYAKIWAKNRWILKVSFLVKTVVSDLTDWGNI